MTNFQLTNFSLYPIDVFKERNLIIISLISLKVNNLHLVKITFCAKISRLSKLNQLEGKLFLIVGPSGSGKSSVLTELKKAYSEYTYPLSATTRPMRKGEKEGDIYHFYTKKDFEKGIKKGEFLEYAIVHQDNYYGLIKKPVVDSLEKGETVVREVDIQGFESIRDKISKKNLVTIFVTVPDKQELIDRIVSRATISEDELNKRLVSMYKEFAHVRDCDYLVENKNGELKNTVEKYLDLLEKVFVIYKRTGFSRNLRKEITKNHRL